MNAFSAGLLVAAAMDKKNPTLEYWREEIERQRINFLQSIAKDTIATQTSQEASSSQTTNNVWICTKCGTTNPSGTLLCQNCGH